MMMRLMALVVMAAFSCGVQPAKAVSPNTLDSVVRQHAVGERRRGPAACRESTRGADLCCVSYTVKWRHRVVVGI